MSSKTGETPTCRPGTMHNGPRLQELKMEMQTNTHRNHSSDYFELEKFTGLSTIVSLGVSIRCRHALFAARRSTECAETAQGPNSTNIITFLTEIRQRIVPARRTRRQLRSALKCSDQLTLFSSSLSFRLFCAVFRKPSSITQQGFYIRFVTNQPMSYTRKIGYCDGPSNQSMRMLL